MVIDYRLVFQDTRIAKETQLNCRIIILRTAVTKSTSLPEHHWNYSSASTRGILLHRNACRLFPRSVAQVPSAVWQSGCHYSQPYMGAHHYRKNTHDPEQDLEPYRRVSHAAKGQA